MEGITADCMAKQAQQIWTMLDDMAENDPAAYRKFIGRHLKEGKEHMAPPDPHMCVQVRLLTKPPKPLFINFCSWKHVPELKNSQDPVPVTGTSIMQEKDEKGEFSIVSVAFNPKVLKEYGRNCTNMVDGDTLIQLALDYIEHEQKVNVTRSYTILPMDTPYKGNLDIIRFNFTKMLKKDPVIGQDDKSELEKTFGPLISNTEESLLTQLSDICNVKSSHSPDFKTYNSSSDYPEISIAQTLNPNMKKQLIEEIKDTRLPTPKYSLELCDSEIGRQLVLKVELPDVKSVTECELDISEDDIMLLVPEKFELRVKLPSCIDDDAAQAKFSKKLSILTVCMPIKS